mmetsp:Transcript_16802/g.16228  ORF Transcript_16802/g.16228 Transcript_16802/m.16228 type:complete len:85 (+) Transcript_16802:135-389(+)
MAQRWFNFKALLLSHITVFVAGIIAGRRVGAEDAEELRTYRQALSASRWRRRGLWVIGVTTTALTALLWTSAVWRRKYNYPSIQ